MLCLLRVSNSEGLLYGVDMKTTMGCAARQNDSRPDVEIQILNKNGRERTSYEQTLDAFNS